MSVSSVAIARNGVAVDSRVLLVATPFAWAVAFAVLYWLTQYEGLPTTRPAVETTFPALAQAWLDGHLSVPFRPELELIPTGDGRGWVPLPPVPALVHLPFVAIGIAVAPQLLASTVAGSAVGLTFALLSRMRVGLLPASLITVGIATSTLWYVASEGGRMWMFAHVVALAFGTASMLVAMTGRWPLAAGLLLGFAAGSRLPMGLMLPVLVYLYRDRRWSGWLPLLAGVAVIAAPVALYNLARFGSPLDFGYARIPSAICSGTVLCEPWYREGILSLTYVPRSLGAALLSGFHIRNEAPWLLASGMSLSLAITAPILLLAVRAGRSRLVLVLWASIALVMLPNLAHGNVGAWQYGYRYILDAVPLFAVLLGLVYRDRVEWGLGLAVGGGALATIYGLLLFHVWYVAA